MDVGEFIIIPAHKTYMESTSWWVEDTTMYVNAKFHVPYQQYLGWLRVEKYEDGEYKEVAYVTGFPSATHLGEVDLTASLKFEHGSYRLTVGYKTPTDILLFREGTRMFQGIFNTYGLSGSNLRVNRIEFIKISDNTGKVCAELITDYPPPSDRVIYVNFSDMTSGYVSNSSTTIKSNWRMAHASVTFTSDGVKDLDECIVYFYYNGALTTYRFTITWASLEPADSCWFEPTQPGGGEEEEEEEGEGVGIDWKKVAIVLAVLGGAVGGVLLWSRTK